MLLLCAVIFAVIVLATSLPVSELLHQRQTLSSTARQVATLQAQNRALARETRQLSDPSTVAGIARRDYGLVAPGSQAYEILPTSGASTTSGQSSGHVPLDGPPVVPGSALSQEILGAGTALGGLNATGQIKPASAGSATGAKAARGGAGTSAGSAGTGLSATPAGGFWTRVEHTLEFWR